MTWMQRPILEDRRVDILERDRLAVDVESAEALPPQRRDRLGDGVHQPRQRRLRRVFLRHPLTDSSSSSSTSVSTLLFGGQASRS